MDTFGKQRAAKDQYRADHLHRRQTLVQQQGGEDHGAQRLQIAANRHGLNRERTDSGEVAPAAKACVDDAQQQYPRPACTGDGHGKPTLAQQQKKYCGGGRKHLQQGVFHAVHALGFFVEDQHDGVAYRAHNAVNEACRFDLPAA